MQKNYKCEIKMALKEKEEESYNPNEGIDL